MFSQALKSFTSNINSNYSVASTPSSTSGPWKIYDAKKKSTGKDASVFVFDKKSLEPQGGASLSGRTNAASLKRAQEEVLERLRKEAKSLSRLRHPSILELAEPVEETRSGGLMFATEPVTASLAGLLQDKDEQEKRSGGANGRSSRFAVEEADGKGRRRRELELDELEIQKGLLQIGKGLEFLHESAGLVHGNLTPDAIFVNAKSDWKISGLGFSSPPDGSTTASSVTPISLSEALSHDPRLPRSVQLNLDYTSPDFVMDTNISSAADMFSLGLLIVALYNSPHRSPLETNASLSAYKRTFSSSSSVPTASNNYLSASPLPRPLSTDLLPRLITRRPAQRLNAREFQQAGYFDNILVSTIRFLDSLPAKTPNEKSQFMRGLPRILPQFPKAVLEKKVLPALLDEMKDKDLLALVLQNIFKIVNMMPSGRRAFCERVIPRLREVFLSSKGAAQERDSLKEAGLMVVLENMSTISDNTTGKEFKDDILPIILLALDSPTHSIVDAALRTLPVILYVLDFSTIKNELFPTVANVFAKTNSMGIKIRGLQAFQTLCGGSSVLDANNAPAGDGLDGVAPPKEEKKKSNSAVLDKYTIQEKVVPLLKAIKTKEPAVMMAALEVFKEVGKIADSDYLAMDVLPVLWHFCLGPLLNLAQFQAFMSLIKSLSTRIEQEQTRKLQELSASNSTVSARADDFMSFGGTGGSNGLDGGNGDDDAFQNLVLGKGKPSSGAGSSGDMMGNGWGAASASTTARSSTPTASFSWSTPPPQQPAAPPAPSRPMGLAPQNTGSRAITPDNALSSFASLQPSNPHAAAAAQPAFSQPLQPARPGIGVMSPSSPSTSTMSMNTMGSMAPMSAPPQGTAIDWSAATRPAMSSWGSQQSASMASGQSFAIKPPPMGQGGQYSGFGIAPPPASGAGTMGQQQQQQQQGRAQMGGGGATAKQGMDKFESLL